jgi:hypothetical protein
VYFDRAGTGTRKPVDPSKPYVLTRNDKTGNELAIRSPSLDRALDAFQLLSGDAQAEAEGRWYFQQFRTASERYLGKWYRTGDKAVCRIEWKVTWQGDVLSFQAPNGNPEEISGIGLHLNAAGELDVTAFGGSVRLSPNGRQIDFAGTGERWVKE